MRFRSGRPSDAAPDGATRSARESQGRRPKRRILPLSIRASLVIIVLVPVAVAVGLTSSVVAHQVSQRQQAVQVRQSSLGLDSLLRARTALYSEYVPSAAIVAARLNNLTEDQLDSLLGVDFKANLVQARKLVDQQQAFSPKGAFAADHLALLSLRHSVDNGTATPASVEALFNGFGSQVDAAWTRTLNGLQRTQTSDSSLTSERLTALDASFNAFTSGLGEESLQKGGSLETVLVNGATPAAIESLIVSHQKFSAATQNFPHPLGPKSAAAWSALMSNPLSTEFAGYVRQGIAVGLNHSAPPFATNAPAVAKIGRSEVEWANSLTHLVLASSVDLRVATDNQANSATSTLEVSVLLIALIILLSLGGVFTLSRAVRRPIAKLGAAFESLREGELELPQLDESGPRELALTASAFNEMASTLRGVQAQAIALSSGNLDDPALQTPLPGRMGEALQSALSNLHISMQASEIQREELFERATRDALTGLLNRGAALESLNIDLAGARRSQGDLVVTILFIDLDDLKNINDSLGHEGGDDAIRAVAEALRATTRASDVVSRYGGDEFVVGWLGKHDPPATALLAKRISELVGTSVVQAGGRSLTIGCSIGVALSGPLDATVLTLIERADHALYEAKKYGRGQVRWFETV
jgi:diguanylate cyclase (GGDEF)-like protein